MLASHKLRIPGRWFDFLALLILAGMVAWFCDGMLLAGQIPFFRDLGTYSYPIKFVLSESLKAGELGLWNHNMAGGFPLLAAFQPGPFYPPSWLFYLLPFVDAVRWTFVFHFFIAASGAYYLCRHWKCPYYVSLIGSLIFALGGTTVSLSNLLNHFQTAVWLPWILLAWEYFFVVRSWACFLVLCVVLLCSLLAGSPEFYGFSMGLLLVDGSRLCARDHNLRFCRVLVYLLAANLTVAALGMAQFLPTAELLQQSRREGAIPFPEASSWSLDPRGLIGLVVPDKEADNSLPIGVRLFFARDVPLLLTHYLGILSILALFAWGYFCSWKERGVVVLLIIVSLGFAFGRFTPVYGFLFEQVPLIRIIRFPEKFFFITFALLVYVVVQGLLALHRSKICAPNVPVAVLAFLLLCFTGTYVYCRMHPEQLSALLLHLSSGQAAKGTATATIVSIFITLERQIGITMAFLLVYFCASKNFLRPGLQQIFLILIVLFDLGTAHKPMQFLLDPAIITRSERILPDAASKNGRLFYYPMGGNLHPSSLTVMGWPSYSKAAALSFENLLPNTGVFYGFEYFQEIDALTRRPYNDFLDFANRLPPDKRVPLLRATNVRYVISFQPLDLPGLHLVKRFQENLSWLYEIDNPLPRVYISSKPILENDKVKTLQILSSEEFDPHQQVVVEKKITTYVNKSSTAETRVVRYGNSHVIIEATLASPGILVLADSYYPGWRVFVDDKEGKILRVNHFFRGVQLTPGIHKVEFRYEPLSFTVGIIISLISFLTVIAISLVLLYLRRRSRVAHAQEMFSRQPTPIQPE